MLVPFAAFASIPAASCSACGTNPCTSRKLHNLLQPALYWYNTEPGFSTATCRSGDKYARNWRSYPHKSAYPCDVIRDPGVVAGVSARYVSFVQSRNILHGSEIASTEVGNGFNSREIRQRAISACIDCRRRSLQQSARFCVHAAARSTQILLLEILNHVKRDWWQSE